MTESPPCNHPPPGRGAQALENCPRGMTSPERTRVAARGVVPAANPSRTRFVGIKPGTAHRLEDRAGAGLLKPRFGGVADGTVDFCTADCTGARAPGAAELAAGSTAGGCTRR